MTEDATKLYGAEHIRRYRETGGEVGHIWKEGSTILLLTTKGRTSGEPRTAPLIYARDGDRYVIIASQGGAPKHPGLVPQPREGSRTSSSRCWTRSSPRMRGRPKVTSAIVSGRRRTRSGRTTRSTSCAPTA